MTIEEYADPYRSDKKYTDIYLIRKNKIVRRRERKLYHKLTGKYAPGTFGAYAMPAIKQVAAILGLFISGYNPQIQSNIQSRPEPAQYTVQTASILQIPENDRQYQYSAETKMPEEKTKKANARNRPNNSRTANATILDASISINNIQGIKDTIKNIDIIASDINTVYPETNHNIEFDTRDITIAKIEKTFWSAIKDRYNLTTAREIIDVANKVAYFNIMYNPSERVRKSIGLKDKKGIMGRTVLSDEEYWFPRLILKDKNNEPTLTQESKTGNDLESRLYVADTMNTNLKYSRTIFNNLSRKDKEDIVSRYLASTIKDTIAYALAEYHINIINIYSFLGHVQQAAGTGNIRKSRMKPEQRYDILDTIRMRG